MRNIRPILLILISLAIGVMTVFFALHWINQRTEITTKHVVVAARDLPFGTQLQANMLEVIDWPVASALKEPIEDPAQVLLRVINTPIARGEPVLITKLAAVGEKGGLSALLPAGLRAITVKVNEIGGVAGFALPGNYVDVMVHAFDPNGHPASKIVLERILVLALAQDTSTSETKPRLVNAVTLEVTPQQAETIDFARSIGSLSLVLRSQVDVGQSHTTGAGLKDLFTGEAQQQQPSTVIHTDSTPTLPAIKPPPTSAGTYEMIRGTKKTLE